MFAVFSLSFRPDPDTILTILVSLIEQRNALLRCCYSLAFFFALSQIAKVRVNVTFISFE